MNRRNLRIALDHAYGTTMAVLAEREGLSLSRIGQICIAVESEVRKELECREVGALEIGLMIQRKEFFWRQCHNGESLRSTRLPGAESFHFELRRERISDYDAILQKGIES
jgi:hypothetical protein